MIAISENKSKVFYATVVFEWKYHLLEEWVILRKDDSNTVLLKISLLLLLLNKLFKLKTLALQNNASQTLLETSKRESLKLSPNLAVRTKRILHVETLKQHFYGNKVE